MVKLTIFIKLTIPNKESPRWCHNHLHDSGLRRISQWYKVSFYILLPDVRNGDAGCFLKVTYYLCRIVALPRIRKLRDNANIK